MDESNGAKDNEGYKVKITTKTDVSRLLHSGIFDDKELKRKKAGARLAFDIYFRAGFYERLIMKHFEKLEKEGKIPHAQAVLDFFTEKKSDLYKEFFLSNW